MSSGTGPTSPRTERLNTKAAGIIGLAVMCSRVLGLVREQVCAKDCLIGVHFSTPPLDDANAR